MATWTEATEAFIDKVEATIGVGTKDYYQIPEAIDLDEAGDAYLNRGYGVDIGGASRKVGTVKQIALEDRTYLVSLTRLVNRVATDPDGRDSLKQEMIEVSEDLRSAFDADHQLGGKVIDVNWVSDSGVGEFLETDRDKFYIMGIQFTLTIEFK